MTEFKGVKFSEKAIGCLELAELIEHRNMWRKREERMMQMCRAYSPRAVAIKTEELIKRGYIRFDGILTDKGRAALAYVRGGSNGEGQG